ncbi:sulfate/molybdate ABC transporter ATP-binding protein [Clostridium sp.]|jgi:molybdate transport system ATP-binding protein|uniref:sulfate/molybdate ABC transporter ATP-binding protein n=1 Tax=Clostridium sp. TaxID=1506 RepID=UPI00341BCDDB
MGLYVDIKKHFRGFDLKIKFETENNIMGLLGASGSGKSMTLKCISGLVTPDQGSIVLNKKVLFDSERRINVPIRKRRVGFLFQNYALFPNMTVIQNIGFALENIPKEDRQKIVEEKIKMMNLEGLEKRFPSQLSGGQQQRVAIARALAIDPEVLLLDEPFSALDSHLRNRMEREIVDILSRYRGTAVFVSHNRDEIYRICNSIAVIDNGNIDAYGDRNYIFSKPPTMAAAQLTGCKNISKIDILNEKTVEALEWGCTIKLKNKIEGTPQYIGIRAHYVDIVDDDSDDNVFKCRVDSIVESPFTVMIHLNIIDDKPYRRTKYLECEIEKEIWNNLKNVEQPWNVYINPEKVFLIK